MACSQRRTSPLARTARARQPARMFTHADILAEAVHERFGIAAAQLRRQDLAHVAAGMGLPDEPNQIRQIINSAPLDQLDSLIASVTVSESYFFRDARQMQALRQVILPELISRHRLAGELRLRIWSVAAAAGQELHTIAIIMCELLPDLPAWSLELIGTDIDPVQLGRAVSGSYSAHDLRAVPDEVTERYFTAAQERFILDERVRTMSGFRQLNILDTAAARQLGAMDLVLCRNLLIYFDEPSRLRAEDVLRESIAPGGVLMMGHAESLPAPPRGLVLDHTNDVYFYRAPEPAQDRASGSAAAAIPVQRSVQPSSARPTARAGDTTKPMPPARVPTRACRPLAVPVPPARELPARRWPQLLADEDWRALLEACEPDAWRDPIACCFTALAVQGLGRGIAAAALLAEAVTRFPTSADVHYLTGIERQDHGADAAAVTSLRRSLYLRRDFPEAEFHLGLILGRLADEARATRHFQRALNGARRRDPSDRLIFDASFTYGDFAEWLQRVLREATAATAATKVTDRGRRAERFPAHEDPDRS